MSVKEAQHVRERCIEELLQQFQHLILWHDF